MFKTISIILLILFTLPILKLNGQTSGVTNVTITQTNKVIPYINQNQLPKWVPSNADIRSQLTVIFNAAIDMANVKSSLYEIVGVRVIDGWVYVTVKRSVLIEEIKIGQFQNVKSATLEGGVLKTTFTTGGSISWAQIGIGAGVGLVLGFLIGRK